MDVDDVRLNIKLIECSELGFYPVDLYKKTLAELLEGKKENDNLKCCGNCEKLIGNTYCDVDDENVDVDSYCGEWKSDNLTRDEREI